MREEPKKEPAPFLSRLLAFLIDFTIVVVVSVFGSTLLYNAFLNNDPKLVNAYSTQEVHLESSHLANKNGKKFVTYTSSEYFEKTDDGYKIIDVLSYFYVTYLTNDTEKITSGQVGSPNYNVPMDVNGTSVLPKDYYTVKWFNEDVLGLSDGEKAAKNDYFAYKTTEDEQIDYTKIGTVNDKYIEDGVVKASDEMINYVYEEYKVAVNNLQSQDYYVNAAQTLIDANALIAFLTRLSIILIVCEILPLCLKRGKSLGKLAFRLSLIRPNGDPIQRWQTLPRGLIYCLIPLVMYLVPNLIAQVAVIAVIVTASLVLFFVSKTKRALHDFVSYTMVIEDEKKPKEEKKKVQPEVVAEAEDNKKEDLVL